MSQILWIEDFNSRDGAYINTTIENLFNDIIVTRDIPHQEKPLRDWLRNYRVIIAYNFLESLEFIRIPEKMMLVDYVVLDIDLPIKDDLKDEKDYLSDYYAWHGFKRDNNLSDSENEEKKRVAAKDLKTKAGYHIYIELVHKLGFPKDHIAICTNHGDKLESRYKAFEEANIKPPKIIDKNPKEANQWIKEIYYNSYSLLRRGVIEGSSRIRQAMNNKEFRIQRDRTSGNELFNNNDLMDLLETIELILPLKEPGQDKKQSLFRLLARTLTQNWAKIDPRIFNTGESNNDVRVFGPIMKMIRNWSSHTDRLNMLDEKHAAFLFMAAARSMFELDERPLFFERILLDLFKDTILSQDELNKRFAQDNNPLANSYKSLKEKIKGQSQQALYFDKILDNLERSGKIKNKDIGRLLLQAYWHNLFPVKIAKIVLGKDNISVAVIFRFESQKSKTEDYFRNIKKDSFNFIFASSIFRDSFE